MDRAILLEEILHPLRLVVYPTIYKVIYIPGGAGFLPSTVSCHVWTKLWSLNIVIVYIGFA